MTSDPSDEAKVLSKDVAARVAVALGLVRQLKKRHVKEPRVHVPPRDLTNDTADEATGRNPK